MSCHAIWTDIRNWIGGDHLLFFLHNGNFQWPLLTASATDYSLLQNWFCCLPPGVLVAMTFVETGGRLKALSSQFSTLPLFTIYMASLTQRWCLSDYLSMTFVSSQSIMVSHTCMVCEGWLFQFARSRDTSRNKSRCLVVIPYIRSTTEAMQQIYNSFNISSGVRPHTTLENY